MKRIKRLLCILVCCVCTGFSACVDSVSSEKAPYEFLMEKTEISSIEIGVFYLYPYRIEEDAFFESLLVIENHEEFLTEFRALECRKSWGVVPKDMSLVIKILYNTTEYEMIGYQGQFLFTIDRYESIGYGYFINDFQFPEDEFNLFLYKYLNTQQ